MKLELASRILPLVVLIACLSCGSGGSSSATATTAPLVLASPTPQATATATQRGQTLPIEAETTIGSQKFLLEVARTPDQQQIGLMFRTSMPADRGMVFPFTPPQETAFWMFNTLIPLDIIFVSEGKVVYIAANVPGCPNQPCPSYGPAQGQKVDQVVELNGKTAAQIGLKVGDPLVVTFRQPTTP